MPTQQSKGQIEAAISKAMIQFEREHMGRGPRDARTWLIQDMVLVRLLGVLTPAEEKLAQEPEGKTLLKQVRTQLIESSRPLLESIVHDITGVPVIEGYGQSEAGPVISFNPLHGTRKPGSVGIPVPDTEVQVVDLEQGSRPLTVGEKGEIRLRGPQLMTQYRNLPQETAQALRDGWLYTGDIGEFDADGYLYIRDRKKEMAKVSGFNVFPREIEEVLFMHPGVQEAAVVAAPDDYRGEVVKAFVVARGGGETSAEQLMAHCQANLAKYKLPVSIDLVSQLPKTAVGKIDKNRLRADLAGGQQA